MRLEGSALESRWGVRGLWGSSIGFTGCMVPTYITELQLEVPLIFYLGSIEARLCLLGDVISGVVHPGLKISRPKYLEREASAEDSKLVIRTGAVKRTLMKVEGDLARVAGHNVHSCTG